MDKSIPVRESESVWRKWKCYILIQKIFVNVCQCFCIITERAQYFTYRMLNSGLYYSNGLLKYALWDKAGY